jgi:hypothetical protein
MADEPTQQADETAGSTAHTAVDEEAVRRRAYEISQREDAGSPEDNWHRAIVEIQAEQATSS